MPDRHSELPAHPDLDYYRKQASTCCARTRRGMRPPGTGPPRYWVTGPPSGSCSATSSSSWPKNTDSGIGPSSVRIQSQRTTGDRPVSRLWGSGPRDYSSRADALLTELRRGDPDALQRLRAYVPRYAAATDASTAELRDARLIIRPGTRLPDLAGARGVRREIPAR